MSGAKSPQATSRGDGEGLGRSEGLGEAHVAEWRRVARSGSSATWAVAGLRAEANAEKRVA